MNGLQLTESEISLLHICLEISCAAFKKNAAVAKATYPRLAAQFDKQISDCAAISAKLYELP